MTKLNGNCEIRIKKPRIVKNFWIFFVLFWVCESESFIYFVGVFLFTLLRLFSSELQLQENSKHMKYNN